MFCTRCGVQTGELDKFCSQCGSLAPGPVSQSAQTVTGFTGAPPQLAPQMTRSLRNRKIAGVCGGLGRYFGVDPTIVRILFLVMFFCPILPAIIPYFVCWIVMPLERPEPLAMPSYAAPAGQPLTALSR